LPAWFEVKIGATGSLRERNRFSWRPVDLSGREDLSHWSWGSTSSVRICARSLR
jgi:hypothetical protein